MIQQPAAGDSMSEEEWDESSDEDKDEFLPDRKAEVEAVFRAMIPDADDSVDWRFWRVDDVRGRNGDRIDGVPRLLRGYELPGTEDARRLDLWTSVPMEAGEILRPKIRRRVIPCHDGGVRSPHDRFGGGSGMDGHVMMLSSHVHPHDRGDLNYNPFQCNAGDRNKTWRYGGLETKEGRRIS